MLHLQLDTADAGVIGMALEGDLELRQAVGTEDHVVVEEDDDVAVRKSDPGVARARDALDLARVHVRVASAHRLLERRVRFGAGALVDDDEVVRHPRLPLHTLEQLFDVTRTVARRDHDRDQHRPSLGQISRMVAGC